MATGVSIARTQENKRFRVYIHRISQTAYNKGKDTKVFIRYKSLLKRHSTYSG